MHNNTSRRNKDPNKNASHNSKHNHNEHMLSSTPNILGTPRILHKSLLRLIKNTNSLDPGNPSPLHVSPIAYLRVHYRPIRQKSDGASVRDHAAATRVVEVKRRDQFVKNPFKPISLFWLAFQYAVFGIADMFAMVGLMEFFYKEAPFGMRSLSTSFALISLSFGYFLSSAFVHIVNAVTEKVTPSKQGYG